MMFTVGGQQTEPQTSWCLVSDESRTYSYHSDDQSRALNINDISSVIRTLALPIDIVHQLRDGATGTPRDNLIQGTPNEGDTARTRASLILY
jgi:hypothetical protein